VGTVTTPPLSECRSPIEGRICYREVREVCASNPIFAQSREEADSGYPECADLLAGS